MRSLILLSLAAIAAPAHAALVVVNSESDTEDGACNVAHCSLREAIVAANTTADFDTLVDFAIPGGGTRTIVLLTPLPALTKSASFFGFSQPGASRATNSNLNHVIRVQVDGSQLSDAGTVVGIDVAIAGQFASFRMEGMAFGGFTRPQGGGVALHLRDGRAEVVSNHFGMAADGSTLASNDVGIRVDTIRAVNLDGNLVSGNIVGILGHGRSTASETPLRITGNRIGTDKAGAAARPNAEDGIRIESTCALPSNELDVTSNLVSGNGRDGIHLTGPGACNLVTGRVAIANNRIGTAANGTGALANGRHGVFANLLAGAESVVIGSGVNTSTVQDRNTIGFNGGAGVRVPDGAGGVTIRENTFRANVGLPIDIGNDGGTPNDGGDADTGGNRRLNSPILGTLQPAQNGVQVSIAMDGATSAVSYPVRIDLYATAAGAMSFLQTEFVEAPNAPKTVTLTMPGGTELVAMASDNLNGETPQGATPSNSSEFSAPALRVLFRDGFE